jgi:hypothetical protein
MSKFPICVYFIEHISVLFNANSEFCNHLWSISRFFKSIDDNKIDFLQEKAL